MLIDADSKPQDTIFYIAIQIRKSIMKLESVKLSNLDLVFTEIDPKQPSFKYYLGLNFLYLLGEVELINDEVRYVSS